MRYVPFAVLPWVLAPLLAQVPLSPAPTWHTDLAAAKKLAAEKHAPLFATFRCER